MKPGGHIGWRGKLLLAILSPVLFLALLEVVLRVVGFRYEGASSSLEDRARRELDDLQAYERDPELLWTLRRATFLDAPRKGFPGVETNAGGLRGAPLPGPKRPGEVRVLCLGDSITFSLGLRDRQAWPVLMQAALRRAPELEGREVTVINGGVPGWSSVQGLRLLRRLSGLEPDLIVFWFGMNDASPVRGVPDSAVEIDLDPSRVVEALRGLRAFQLIARIAESLRSGPDAATRVSPGEFRGVVDELLEMERDGGPPTLFVRVPERIDVTLGQLERIATRAREEGVDLIAGPAGLLSWVLPAPPGSDLTGRRAVWRGRDAILFAADAGNPVVERVDTYIELSELERDARRLAGLKRSLDTLLEALPEGSLRYRDLFGEAPPDLVFLDNCHLNAAGAKLAGEALARRAIAILGR